MAVVAAPANSPAGQTMSGAVVGTVAYMAPEQARAEPVDQRADIYTLGLILYDLLLGRARASSAESAFDELNTRMVQSPPAPRTKDASIPEAIDKIIARCIQPAADARYPTIAEMLADLEKLDDNGKPLPMVRRLTWRIGAAAALVVASLRRRERTGWRGDRPCLSCTNPSRCSSRTSRTAPAMRRSTRRSSR